MAFNIAFYLVLLCACAASEDTAPTTTPTTTTPTTPTTTPTTTTPTTTTTTTTTTPTTTTPPTTPNEVTNTYSLQFYLNFWATVNYPPEAVRDNGTDYFKRCFENRGTDDQRYIKYVCVAYFKSVDNFVKSVTYKERQEMSEKTEALLKIIDVFDVCEFAKILKLRGVADDIFSLNCTYFCSVTMAPKVCQLLAIMTVIDSKSIPSRDEVWRALSPSAETHENKQVTKEPPPKEPSTKPPPKEPPPKETPPKEPPTKPPTKEPPTKEPPVKPPPVTEEASKEKPVHGEPATQNAIASTNYGNVALYVMVVLVCCMGLYIVYSCRASILSCLREKDTPHVKTKRYRKLPTFERIVPTDDDRESSKQFIY